MKLLLMNNVYIIFLSLTMYNYLFQGFTCLLSTYELEISELQMKETV